MLRTRFETLKLKISHARAFKKGLVCLFGFMQISTHCSHAGAKQRQVSNKSLLTKHSDIPIGRQGIHIVSLY